MSFSRFTPLMNLNSTKIKWNIRVRAQAIWRGITRDTKEFRGINIIFVDDSLKNARIHAFIGCKLCQLFESELKEGEIYTISNFNVRAYTGVEFNRCLRSENHFYFADFTILKKDSNPGLKIPNYSFDILDLVATEKMEDDNRFLCDVIGVIESKPEIVEYSNDKNEEKFQLKFSITDGRSSRNVTFFDGFAKHVAEEVKDNCEETKIVIIASAKVNKYAGELYLTNYPPTRFYLNVKHYSVQQLRIKASEPSFFKAKQIEFDSPQVCVPYDCITIADLKDLKKVYIGLKVLCKVNVKKIEGGLDWYYSICVRCKKDLDLVHGRFQCKTCARVFPHPDKMYRVCTICSDHTGAVAIIFKDHAVRKITGKTVFEVILHEAEEGLPGQMPAVLQQMLFKDLTVTLELNEENVNFGSNVYEAADISLGFLTVPTQKPTVLSTAKSTQHLSDASSTSSEMESEENFNENEVEDDEIIAPENTPLPKMLTNKSRARKSPQMALQDDDNTLPSQETPLPKIPKKTARGRQIPQIVLEDDDETFPSEVTTIAKMLPKKSRVRKTMKIVSEEDDENVPLSKMQIIKKEKI